MILKMWLCGAAFAFALGAAACGGKGGEAGGGGGSGEVATAPTKETLIAQLDGVMANLEARDFEAAAANFIVPPDATKERVIEALGMMAEKQEISRSGVKILAEKGTFGTLAEVFPEKGAKRAERVPVNPAECFGMNLGDAEVMAHWDGKMFKIFRLDDVGKLEAPKGE